MFYFFFAGLRSKEPIKNWTDWRRPSLTDQKLQPEPKGRRFEAPRSLLCKAPFQSNPLETILTQDGVDWWEQRAKIRPQATTQTGNLTDKTGNDRHGLAPLKLFYTHITESPQHRIWLWRMCWQHAVPYTYIKNLTLYKLGHFWGAA